MKLLTLPVLNFAYYTAGLCLGTQNKLRWGPGPTCSWPSHRQGRPRQRQSALATKAPMSCFIRIHCLSFRIVPSMPTVHTLLTSTAKTEVSRWFVPLFWNVQVSPPSCEELRLPRPLVAVGVAFCV